MILTVLFVLFGIMNPAVAKLTPWMLELLSDSLAESGMTVSEITVDAAASWTQFFKNIPMALIIFLLVTGGIFTNEYQSGTLVLLLTKGLKRSQTVIAKTAVLIIGWTVGYYICFAITYGYNAYFWDNSIMEQLPMMIFGWWLFGIWTVALTVFFSSVFKNTSGVLSCTLGAVILSYILELIPKLKQFTQTSLMQAADSGMIKAVLVTVIMSAVLIITSIPILNNKEL